MKNQNIHKDWLTEIHQTFLEPQGILQDLEALGQPVTIEWIKTNINSPELVAFKQAICDLASEVIAISEMEFLKKHPEAVSQEIFLNACAPLLENKDTPTDWKAVEETIQKTIKQFYLTDISKFGAEVIKHLLNDIYFMMTIKDKADKLIGFLMSAVTPALPFGHMKIISIVIPPQESHRGLTQCLINSLFTLVPTLQSLFLFVRPTNLHDLQTYRSLGFAQAQNPFEDPNHKINLESLIPLIYHTKT